MAQIQFNARTVEPDTGIPDPVPAGWYNVMADQSSMEATNDGNGAYLEVRYTILDGQYKGRKLFSRFNVRNNSAKAVEIAYRQLSALCHAVQVYEMQDSQQLHGIPLKLKVSLREARRDEQTGKQYEASNEVKAWKHINEPTDAPAAGGAPAGGVPAGFGPPAGQPAAPGGWGQPAAAAPAGYPPAGQPAGYPPANGAPAGYPPANAQPQPQQPQQPWNGGQPAQPAAAPAQPWNGGQPAGYPPAGAPAAAPAAQPWAQPGAPAGGPAAAPAGAPANVPWAGGNPGQATPPWAGGAAG